MRHCRQTIVENYDLAAGLLTAMSNARRLEILCILLEGERSVGDLAIQIGLSQSALSQHLAKLRKRKLVATRRDAQQLYYSVASTSVEVVLNALHGIFDDNGASNEAS